ncbi:hypothetical protein FSP39_003163 [Pinctada imbricata]|uniref:Reverse transcriptase domain-containing protein n=1 Tax=Pinctada imbricata TaxID=66713 RepID=A0AA88XRF7_PINIB|nr:hypothetical protein FSP39_003163 [Pinctada imbricata]
MVRMKVLSRQQETMMIVMVRTRMVKMVKMKALSRQHKTIVMKNCKTCNIPITDTSFSSNLTKQTFNTHSFENLNCMTSNVVYGIECSLCGLIYVGETKGQLRKRMSGHRSKINNKGSQLLYRHFDQADHSVLSMRVRILEKIYHPTNNPNLSTPLRRNREEFWIKNLNTAAPYGCNDNISTIGNLTSPGCQSLHEIYDYTKDLAYTDTRSPEYRLQGVILDISTFRLFQAVRSDKSEEKTNRPFIKVRFANKGIDNLNLGQILNHKTVTEKIPPNFKRKETPGISYSYTPTVASKIYNYKRFLQCIDLSNPSLHPLPCECSSSDFNYSPCGHVITGDLSIVKNDKLRELLKKGPKYRESMSFTWNQNVKIIMDSCEEYARRWAKKEDVQLDTLSEWIKLIIGLLLSRINRLKSTVNTRFVSIFKDPDVITELTYLQEHYVTTPADKASNNYTFYTCKKYYFDSLVKELGLNSTPGNPTYTPTNLSASEIIDNHKSALASFGFDTTNLDLDLPYLNCIPKMHKNPYKQRFIAGSSKCSTKSVSILLTKVLSEIKSGLQKYCSTVYSRSGINQMWILKYSKELLEHLKSTHFSRVHSIKAFDFSRLYTTIPHSKLKERLAKIISNAFTSKNGIRRYKFIVINYDKTYFVKEKSDSENKYTETDIIQMLNFLIDNIFVVFGGKVFQQIVGIPMGTNCAPLLADIFLYSYEAEFIQSLVSEGKRYLASDFNFTYRYIDDVLSINNPKFADYLSSIYPSELEVKETTETNNSASYLDIMLSYDTDGHMNTSLYDKRDDFNFSITNFPFLSSNIPSSPAYGVFISQLIRYARASTKYTDFALRARRLSDKLLNQGYVCDRLTSSLRKLYGRYGELVIHYDVPLSRMVDDILS